MVVFSLRFPELLVASARKKKKEENTIVDGEKEEITEVGDD